MKLLRLWFFVCLALAVFADSHCAQAHPMGNFSINHYTRFTAKSDELALRYVLDFAEIPAADQMAKLDSNSDNAVSAAEESAYLKTVAPQFLDGLSLQIDGDKVALRARQSSIEVRPGAGGLPTLLVKIDAAAPLPKGTAVSVVYADSNFAGRTGWKEILATADAGWAIRDSDAGTQDVSHELTVFPIDAGIVPPRQEGAKFSVIAAGESGAAVTPNAATTNAATNVANRNTPQNRFTQSIAEKTLTPTVIFWGLLFALRLWRGSRPRARPRQNDGRSISRRLARHATPCGNARFNRHFDPHFRRFRAGFRVSVDLSLYSARKTGSYHGRTQRINYFRRRFMAVYVALSRLTSCRRAFAWRTFAWRTFA